MKNGTIIFIATAILLLFYSCSETFDESEANLDEQITLSGENPGFSKKKDKCSVCHFRNAKKGYKKLEISCNAVNTHLGHGDGLIGDAVPGEDGFIFGENCEFVQIQVDCPCFSADDLSEIFVNAEGYCSNDDLIGIYYPLRGKSVHVFQSMELMTCFMSTPQVEIALQTSLAQQEACIQAFEDALSEHSDHMDEYQFVCNALANF